MSKRRYTEVEDFFIKNNAQTLTVEQIAEKLGRPVKSVKSRLEALSTKAEPAQAEETPPSPPLPKNDFVKHKSGAVAMTGSQSFKDDMASGVTPAELRKGENPTYMEQFKNDVARHPVVR